MKLLMLLPMPLALVSCLAYTTPESYVPSVGGQDEFNPQLSKSGRLASSVSLPCSVAVVRLEKNAYTKKVELYDSKSVESPEHGEVLASLPDLSGVVSLNGLLMDNKAVSYDHLRSKARQLGADMLAVYRFSSKRTDRTHSALLTAATLGAAPVHSSKSVSSVSLILMDAKTGYVFGVLEDQAEDKALSTSWGSYDAREKVVETSRKKALDNLMQKLPSFWKQVTQKM